MHNRGNKLYLLHWSCRPYIVGGELIISSRINTLPELNSSANKFFLKYLVWTSLFLLLEITSCHKPYFYYVFNLPAVNDLDFAARIFDSSKDSSQFFHRRFTFFYQIKDRTCSIEIDPYYGSFVSSLLISLPFQPHPCVF